MKMKPITGEGEKIAQTMNNNMAKLNLPTCMIDHLHCAHEPNKTLVKLVEFLASDFRAFTFKLNSIAAACAPLENRISNNVSKSLIDAECMPSKSNTTKDTSIDDVAELKKGHDENEE